MPTAIKNLLSRARLAPLPPTPLAAVTAATLAPQPVAVLDPALVFGQTNVKQQKIRLSRTAKASLHMRNALWPDIGEDKLWLRTDLTRKGYTTIPRGMPLFMAMIAAASKQVTTGKSIPAGQAYLVLWCRVFDEGMVKIENDASAAFEAGYSGERSVATWREHLRVLKALGFIDFKPGSAGPCQYVLLLNPYQAAFRLRASNWVQEVLYTTLLQRMSETGATDLDEVS
jgi:hypothetical protein